MDSSGCIRSDQIRPELLKEVLLSNLSTLRFNLLERINIAVYSAFIGDKSGTLDKSYRIINTDNEYSKKKSGDRFKAPVNKDGTELRES